MPAGPVPRLKWLSHADLAIRKTPTVGREEYLDHMTFRANRRPLFTEIFGPLVGLKEEWEAQGASPAELDFSAFRYRCEGRAFLPVETGRLGGFPELTLEETSEYVIQRDGYGRTTRLVKGAATLPLPLDYPVRNMDDWRRVKPWYEYAAARLAGDWQSQALAWRAAGRVVCVSIPGGFDEPRQLMGEEQLCLACYEQPELLHEMLATIGDTAWRVLEQVSRAVPLDLLFVYEDMAGKSGPLFGPAQVREFIRPYYRKIWDLLAERGAQLFDQDSDGDMRPVIPAFLECGVNLMHPIEPAAGMDIVQLRARYGTRLAFYGGLDKHVLRRTPAEIDAKGEIDAELAYKHPPLLASGGCVLALDHRIPNGVPLENYRFYVRKVWEYLEGWESGKLTLQIPQN